jgi:hypothetical protein
LNPPSVVDRLTESTPLRLLLFLVLAVWFLEPLLLQPHDLGPPGRHDWTYFLHHALSAHRTYVEYHQIPVWDPYFCGGIPALGNLQNNAVSPSFLWLLLFGVGPGLRLAWLTLFVLSLEGTWRYARHLGMRGVGPVAAAVCFSFAGRSVLPLIDGQPVILGFLLMPFIFLGYEKGFRSLRWSAIGGAFMAWAFLEGGAVTTPMLAVVLGALLAYHTVTHWLLPDGEVRWYRPALSLAVMALVTVGLTAFRLIPVVVSVLESPRVWRGDEAYSFLHVVNMLFSPTEHGGYSGPGTSYVGVWAGALAALGVARLDRVGAQLLVMLLATFVLAMGSYSGLGLYELVKSLPVLENLRNPFRYTYFIIFFVALGAARGIDLLERQVRGSAGLLRRLRSLRVPGRPAGLATAFLGTALALLLAWQAASEPALFNRGRLDGAVSVEPAMVAHGEFRQSIGNRWYAHVWPSVNLGSIGCFEEQPFFTSAALRGDLEQEEFLADPQAGTVRRASWSPHRIELDVELSQTATLLVNQNANPAWRTSHGRIVEHDGLLAIEAPAGSYRLVIQFVDTRVRLGLLISLLTVLGLGGLELRRWRAQRRASGSRPSPPAEPEPEPET